MNTVYELSPNQPLILIIIILKSTMKYPNNNKPTQKQTHKKTKPIPSHLEQQINSDHLPSQPEQPNQHTNGYVEEDHRTPQQIKIAIAKKLIQKTKGAISSKREEVRKGKDDFFIVDGDGDDGVRGVQVGKQTQDDELGEQLKNQYLKSKNKLFIDQYSHFKNLTLSQPIAYKGHTKCITAIEITDQKIYSVSKDRSIITWDRETGKKDFITMAKNQNNIDHEGPILCMSYHPVHQMIATAGDDGKIKLWDIRSNSLIDTLKGHRNTVNSLKFGFNSNNLCSVSTDRTMKQWQCAQRGIIQTYYGHNAQVLDIDCINQNDFISSGNDHQNIIWKTQKQTQVIFEGHDYAIDRVRCINQDKFISASQDGYINLWSQKKKKPIYKHQNAHDNWIVALDCIKQSNVFASGGCDGLVKIWAIGAELRNFQKIHQIQSKGIVTDIKLTEKQLVATACDEHRLGRWITTRVRNQIQVYKFSNQ